jgi:DNA-binding MarR family transcriptional regulator
MSVKQSKKNFAVKVDHSFLNKCATNKNLTKKSFRVLMHLFTKIDSRGFIRISQKEISELIDMDKTSVSLALKHLREEQLIEHIPVGQLIKFPYDDDDFEEEFN